MMAEAKKGPTYVLLYAAVVSTLFTAGIMAILDAIDEAAR